MIRAKGKHILKSGLCTGCGLCSVIDPSVDIIEKEGLLQPLSLPKSIDIDFFCPGIGYNLKQMGAELFPDTSYRYELGFYKQLLALRSQSVNTLRHASSGGAITEICKYVLEKQLADGIICTKYDYSDESVRPVSYIAYNIDELMQSQGSKYCPTSTLIVLKEVMQNPDKKYILIGTPCQIAGYRKYSSTHASLRNQIVLCISNFCGGYRDFRELDFYIHRIAGFKKATFFRHRGGGQPGGMKIISETGEEFSAPYPEYAKLSRYVKVERCSLCMDAVAELADISCGDAWLDDLKKDGPWSIAITRSLIAQSIVENMISEKRLCIKKELSEEEVILSQKSNLTSKKYKQYYRILLRSLLFKASPDWHDDFPIKQGSLLAEIKIFFSKEKAKRNVPKQ